VSTEKWQTGTGKYSLLVVMKGEHRYLVKYDPAHKQELLNLLLDYGQRDDFNLTPFDALALIEKLGSRDGGSSVISLNEDAPSIEKDLTFDERAVDSDSGDSFGMRDM